MNKGERHKEKSEVYEETLYTGANLIYSSAEDDFIKKSRYEDLMKAINELPKTIKKNEKEMGYIIFSNYNCYNGNRLNE